MDLFLVTLVKLILSKVFGAISSNSRESILSNVCEINFD